MPAIEMSIEHRQTKADAISAMKAAVLAIKMRFGPLVRDVRWSAGGDAVQVVGIGFELKMHADDQKWTIIGDAPLLAGMLQNPIVAKIKQIITQKLRTRLS